MFSFNKDYSQVDEQGKFLNIPYKTLTGKSLYPMQRNILDYLKSMILQAQWILTLKSMMQLISFI